jgi:WD40 repeat protein
VAFSPDGNILAAGSQDNTVWLWNVAQPRHHLSRDGAPLTGASDWVNAVSFSPDGKLLATAGDKLTRLWDVADPSLPASSDRPWAA